MRQWSHALHWPQEKTCSIDESTLFEAQTETQWNKIQVKVSSGDVWRV